MAQSRASDTNFGMGFDEGIEDPNMIPADNSKPPVGTDGMGHDEGAEDPNLISPAA